MHNTNLTLFAPSDTTNEKHAFRLTKRFFDVLVSASLLLLLSPLFMLIALLIKLENKGPVFYTSKRVGEGYHIFDFYKFRSMRTDADKMLEKMKQMNQYAQAEPANNTEIPHITWTSHQEGLVCDEGIIPDQEWLKMEQAEQKKAFVKFKNDPRITRVGQFIRNTSIDELPQLLNVLKGDMSLVGNRPLPLYEAAKLTSDRAVGRFLGPAGITGLWQVTERGGGKGDPDSRKQLDVYYAENCSLKLDLWILLRTPMAAFQQENV